MVAYKKNTMYRNLIVITLVLLVTSSCSCLKTFYDNKWIVGSWSGTGYQVDEAQWEVELEVDKCGDITINYPDLYCNGYWTRLSESEGIVSLIETIESGTDNCNQGVEIEIFYMDKKTIEVLFYIDWYSDDPVATAELKRK